MIKEAIEYIVGLSKPTLTNYGTYDYSDKPLHVVKPYIPKAETLYLHTLTGLVDYIKSETDSMMGDMIIEVASPTTVVMYSQLNTERDRECIAEVTAMVPYFNFERFIEQESFCIGVQSKFEPTEDRALMLKFAGTVESGTVAEYSDDGVTQKATVKQGLTSKAEGIVPSPVKLIPYRTFLEVDQPESEFIFRMRDSHGVECALFEADGGAWQTEAMERIKFWLKTELKGIPNYTVIA